MQSNRIGAGLERTGTGIIDILTFLVTALLAAAAFFSTCIVTLSGKSGEVAVLSRDDAGQNLLFFLVGLALLYAAVKLLKKISVRSTAAACSVLMLILGTLIIVSANLKPSSYSDSFTATWAGQQAAAGDFSYAEQDYFRRFPYQLGWVLYVELFTRLTGHFLSSGVSELALQELNLVYMILLMLTLGDIARRLFDRETQKLTMLLCVFFLPGLIYATFLYPNTLSFMLGIMAVDAMLAFFEKDSLPYAAAAAVLLAFSVMLKPNSLIILIAVALVWLLHLLKKFRAKSLLALLAVILLTLACRSLPVRIYESRTGVDYGSGVPNISWLAMGLSESDRAPGWYNSLYTVDNFSVNGHNADEAAADSKKVISDRLEAFREDPVYTLKFFAKKFLTQWNTPDYQSLWHLKIQTHYSEPGTLYEKLTGGWEDETFSYMNAYQQLILPLAALGMLALLLRGGEKREACILPLILLGGMLYHLLFEAKAQYSYTYFMLLIPLAAFTADKAAKILRKPARK